MRRARILKAAEICLGTARPPIREPDHEAANTNEGSIEVELRRAGDLVEAILVSCACGRTAEVECLYDALTTDGDETRQEQPVHEEPEPGE